MDFGLHDLWSMSSGLLPWLFTLDAVPSTYQPWDAIHSSPDLVSLTTFAEESREAKCPQIRLSLCLKLLVGKCYNAVRNDPPIPTGLGPKVSQVIQMRKVLMGTHVKVPRSVQDAPQYTRVHQRLVYAQQTTHCP